MEKPRFVRKALPDLEEMYRDWEINCLSGDMPRPQVVEMQRQRAFKSGVSSMFDVMKFDLPKVSDEAVCSCLIRIEGDPNEFFTTGIDLLKGTDLPNGSRGGDG